MDNQQDPAGPALTVSRARWRAARPFVLVAGAAIVLGGLTAAVSGPLGVEHGSWAAAYLVLVVGVGQLVLGVGQAALREVPPAPSLRAWQLGLYDAGSAAVLVGTFVSVPAVVLVGGAVLLAALVLFLAGTRGTPAGRWTVLYRLMATVLVISVPIGLALSVGAR